VLVPGLLQTTDYMRAVIAAYGVRPEEVDGVADERERRQRILRDASRVFHFILGEPVLYTCPAGPAAQVEQLRMILHQMTRRNVRVGLVAATDGTHALAATAFTVYDRKQVVVETMVSEQQISNVADVRGILSVHKLLAEKARYDLAAESLILRAIDKLGRDVQAAQQRSAD
jgi:hypothetical protein